MCNDSKPILDKRWGRSRPTQETTTSRLYDELEGDTEALSYHILQCEKNWQPLSQYDEKWESSSVEASNESEGIRSSSSSPSGEGEKKP